MAGRSPAIRASSTRRCSRAWCCFCVLRILTHSRLKLKTPRFVAGAFVCGYGLSRIFVEFFREPDQQLGYLVRRLADHGHGAVAADGAGRHLGDGDRQARGRRRSTA